MSGGILYAVDSVNASDLKAMPSALPWIHKDLLKGYDHARCVLMFNCANHMNEKSSMCNVFNERMLDLETNNDLIINIVSNFQYATWL